MALKNDEAGEKDADFVLLNAKKRANFHTLLVVSKSRYWQGNVEMKDPIRSKGSIVNEGHKMKL